MPSKPKGDPFIFDLPEGWNKLAPTSMRVINLQPAGDPNTECALTILGGDGGGLAANINRWRGQIGLEAVSEEEVAQLPKGLLLGQDATIVDLRGNYSGMGDTVQGDWGLLGYVLVTDQFTVFVKMTGPGDVLNTERANFEAFCASLSPAPQASDHDSHDPHAPTPPPASSGQIVDQSPPAEQFAYALPDGWTAAAPKSMRSVNLTAGSSSECYLIALGGQGGGLEMNINRWRGEVGLDPMSAAQIAELPTVTLFGTQAPMLEVSGDYQGMGGPTGEEKRVLGVPLIRPGGSVFIKMVGPDAEVAAERDNFIAFVQSLTER